MEMAPNEVSSYDNEASSSDKTSVDKKERSLSEVTSSSIYEDGVGRCGWGSCTPEPLQCCSNAKGFLVVYCLVVTVQGMLVNGFVNVSISSLEKRFGLKSSETGVISTGYDIAFCVLTMFVTYFGARSHRPRAVGIGCFIMGIGALIFWLPHFTTPLYEITDGFSDVCVPNDSVNCESTSSSLHNYLYVFILGQLLHGVGCTPLYTLGLSFIEDSVPKESASVYLGIANAASIFGPVLGYGLGGVVLGFYVDVDTVDMSTIDLTASDPRWVGAWWIGMMLSMVCAFILAIPLLAFPREFPGTKQIRASRESEVPAGAGGDIASKEDFGKSYKDFPMALWMLLKNPTYSLGSLAACSEAMVVSGFTTFLPKIIENQFQQTAGLAAIVAGVISIPGGIVGNIVAGVVIHKLNMKTANMLKFNVACCLIVCISAPVLFLSCSNRLLAGITHPYNEQGEISGVLSSPCNTNCSCQEEFYIPACGIDNVNYFSACHAGCNSSIEINETTYYYDCDCVSANISEGGWSAIDGSCESSCSSLSAFLGVFFVVVMFTFMSSTPALVATFRVVPPNMRSFAIGVQWLLIRALGSIPGPILFGTIIDMSCILWQKRQCDGSKGSCWIYDSNSMAVNVLAISVACKLVSAIFFGLACFFYNPPLETKSDENESKLQTAMVNKAFDLDETSDIKDEVPAGKTHPLNGAVEHFSVCESPIPSTNNNDESVTAL